MTKLAPPLYEMYSNIVAAVEAADTELVPIGEPKVRYNDDGSADIYACTDYVYRAANGLTYDPDFYRHAKAMLAEWGETEKTTPVRKGNARSEANEYLQQKIRELFDADTAHQLTVDKVKKMAFVQEWLTEQGISDDRLTRLIGDAAPDYARSRPGPKSPKDAWER